MLVLSRRPGQSILIGKDIEIVVLGSDGVQVRVGIRAPREVTVLRRELLKQVEEENRRATTGSMVVSAESLGAALGTFGGGLASKAAPANTPPPPGEGSASPSSPGAAVSANPVPAKAAPGATVKIRKAPRAGAA